MTNFLQASVDGLALGSLYALIVLGFVVIYRATGIINFAQGGAVLLGAYLTHNGTATWGWNFYASLAVSIVITAIFSVLLQRAMLQRVFRELLGIVAGLIAWAAFHYNGSSHAIGLVAGVLIGVVAWRILAFGEQRWGAKGPSELPVFGAIMVTIGVLFVIKQIIPSIWGFAEISMRDPWEIGVSEKFGLLFAHSKLATFAMALLGLGTFFLIDRYSKVGLAMRATHFDQEAAIAQGVSTKVVFATAFAIAGALGALAGTAAASGSALMTPNSDVIVFLAFPAMILGGFDSPGGAVVGGLVVGLIQNLVSFYVSSPPDWFPVDDLAATLGAGFERVAVFIVMVAVLLIRPYGLFGTEEVRRL